MFPFFSRMFPSTNLQDLNLDWICRRIMELSKGIIAPWINPDNKHWMVYDTQNETFVDSNVSAAGEGSDYEQLTSKPKINSVTLQGDLSPTDLGLATAQPLSGKTIVILGDSLAADYSASVADPLSDTGLTVYNVAVGGATFCRDDANNVAAQLADIPDGISPDYIMIWAGGNDAAGISNLGTPAFGNHADSAGTSSFESLRHLLYAIRTQYPAAQIIGIIRNNFDETIAGYPRSDYVFGTVGLIYNDWNVPVINLDGISNSDVNIAASEALYYTADNRHYSAYGYQQCDALFSAAILGGLNSHNVRHPHYIITPTATAAAAIAWFVDNYAGGWTGDTKIRQGGYTLLYNNAADKIPVTFCGDGCLIAADDMLTVYRPGLNIENNHGTKHAACLEVTFAAPITDFRSLPTGMVSLRYNSIATNAIGVPSEIITENQNNAFCIMGMWQANGYYKGIMWTQNTLAPNSPIAGLKNIFRVVRDVTTVPTWIYSSLDGSVSFSAIEP